MASIKQEIKQKKPKKVTGNYCFPNIIANVMRKIGQRIQYESSLISMSFILLSIIFVAIYTLFFLETSTGVKIMAGVNGLAAFIFISSHLITTFQQYQSYLGVMGIIEDHSFDLPDIPNSKEVEIPEDISFRALNTYLKGGEEHGKRTRRRA